MAFSLQYKTDSDLVSHTVLSSDCPQFSTLPPAQPHQTYFRLIKSRRPHHFADLLTALWRSDSDNPHFHFIIITISTSTTFSSQLLCPIEGVWDGWLHRLYHMLDDLFNYVSLAINKITIITVDEKYRKIHPIIGDHYRSHISALVLGSQKPAGLSKTFQVMSDLKIYNIFLLYW